MRPMIRPVWPLVIAGTMLLIAACGGPGDPVAPSPSDGAAGQAAEAAPMAPTPVTTLPRPKALASLPLVELLAPGQLDAGRAPDFVWSAVDGAATYRLSVLGPDGPAWAWLGSATTIRYGGVPEGTSGPSLQAGSWWSVAALDAGGAVLALSELRAVSPDGELAPAPGWAGSATPEASAVPEASASPSASEVTAGDGAAHPCQLLSTGEITSAIQGDWSETKEGDFGLGYGWCDWRSVNGTLLSLTVEPASNYDPAGWGADGAIDGLGSEAYLVDHGWDRRIGFVHGSLSVTLIIDFTKVDPTGYEQLARLVDERLP